LKLTSLIEKLKELKDEHGEMDVEFTFECIRKLDISCWSREISEVDVFDFSWENETEKILGITLK